MKCILPLLLDAFKISKHIQKYNFISTAIKGVFFISLCNMWDEAERVRMHETQAVVLVVTEREVCFFPQIFIKCLCSFSHEMLDNVKHCSPDNNDMNTNII